MKRNLKSLSQRLLVRLEKRRQKMVPSRIAPDGSWQEGKPSYELMEKELVDKLLNVGMWDATYQLPIVEKNQSQH